MRWVASVCGCLCTHVCVHVHAPRKTFAWLGRWFGVGKTIPANLPCIITTSIVIRSITIIAGSGGGGGGGNDGEVRTILMAQHV